MYVFTCPSTEYMYVFMCPSTECMCSPVRGGGSAKATTAMAIPIVKQKVGVVNVEALTGGMAFHLMRMCSVRIGERTSVF